jgi:hypothetical protein
MADVHVDVAGIRAAASALAAEGGPITFLENAQAMLAKARLSSWTLTVFGNSTVDANNAAVDLHENNVKGGIQRLRDAAAQLGKTADSWAKSDEPWVVKG